VWSLATTFRLFSFRLCYLKIKMRTIGISRDFFVLINSSLNLIYVPVIIVVYGVELAFLARPVAQSLWGLQMLSDRPTSHGGRVHKNCEEGRKQTRVEFVYPESGSPSYTYNSSHASDVGICRTANGTSLNMISLFVCLFYSHIFGR
jgi:hypothetical protein